SSSGAVTNFGSMSPVAWVTYGLYDSFAFIASGLWGGWYGLGHSGTNGDRLRLQPGPGPRLCASACRGGSQPRDQWTQSPAARAYRRGDPSWYRRGRDGGPSRRIHAGRPGGAARG